MASTSPAPGLTTSQRTTYEKTKKHVFIILISIQLIAVLFIGYTALAQSHPEPATARYLIYAEGLHSGPCGDAQVAYIIDKAGRLEITSISVDMSRCGRPYNYIPGLPTHAREVQPLIREILARQPYPPSNLTGVHIAFQFPRRGGVEACVCKTGHAGALSARPATGGPGYIAIIESTRNGVPTTIYILSGDIGAKLFTAKLYSVENPRALGCEVPFPPSTIKIILIIIMTIVGFGSIIAISKYYKKLVDTPMGSSRSGESLHPLYAAGLSRLRSKGLQT